MQTGGYSRHALINFEIQFLPGTKSRQAVIKDPAANRGNTVYPTDSGLHMITYSAIAKAFILTTFCKTAIVQQQHYPNLDILPFY